MSLSLRILGKLIAFAFYMAGTASLTSLFYLFVWRL